MYNYQKLNGMLLDALSRLGDDSEAPKLTIFIQTDRELAESERERLRAYGARGNLSRGSMFTATVPPQTVGALSEEPWVRSLRLAETLKMIGAGQR